MNKALILTVLIVTLLVKFSTQHALPPGVTDCHPTPNHNKVQYLIGYGSLINAKSKNTTYPDTGLNIPVTVSGFKRTWTARGWSNSSLSTTYLGIDVDPKSSLNGVIFSVPDAEAVEKYDARERLYCRVQVPWKDISIVRGNKSDNGTFPTEDALRDSEFWIYVTIPTFRAYPNDEYPIVQSYVDIFLGGCVQMEKKYGLTNYSQDCVTSTVGWEHPWVNDRIHPRRPFSNQPDSYNIDRLISKNIPGHKDRIYLERIYVGRSASTGWGIDPITPLIFTTATAAVAIFH